MLQIINPLAVIHFQREGYISTRRNGSVKLKKWKFTRRKVVTDYIVGEIRKFSHLSRLGE